MQTEKIWMIQEKYVSLQQTSMTMKKGDCILCPGEKERTLYYITNVRGDKCEALKIYISSAQIQALDYPNEYDIDLPDNVVFLPSDTYKKVKGIIKEYVIKMRGIIKKEVIRGDFEIIAGYTYTQRGFIYTMDHIEDNRWYYKVFRIEEEFVSPHWTGNASIDSLKDYLLPISEKTIDKVLRLYNSLQKDITDIL